MVMPQRWQAIGGRYARGIYENGTVIGLAHDEFLTPVAEDIAYSTRVILRPVVAFRIREVPPSAACTLAGRFVYCAIALRSRAVKVLIEQVSVPVYALIEVAP